jgi:hypothetical protein
MVRGQLTACLGLRVAAPAGGEDDGVGLDRLLTDASAPAAVALVEVVERRVLEGRAAAALPRLAEALGDRVPGAVADL